MRSFSAVARLLLAGVMFVFVGVAAAQQAYPSKPIRFIVPFPPGGSTDPLARLVGQKLSDKWGQAVIVDNRPGGNTIIGTEALVKSPPDGYTILLVTRDLVLLPHLVSYLPYDPIKDFTAVATLAKAQFILVLHPSVPANNLQEFIALAKSKPGQLNYASSGLGNATHLAAELFQSMTGVKLQHIPYKGGAAALTDLLGGRVQLWFPNTVGISAHINSGKLKGIAVTGDKRFASMPQVPTFDEAGLRGFEMAGWFGILAPAGTAKEIVDKISKEVALVLAMPDVSEKLESQGSQTFTSTPEQFAALLKSELARYGKIIKSANIKIEQ